MQPSIPIEATRAVHRMLLDQVGRTVEVAISTSDPPMVIRGKLVAIDPQTMLCAIAGDHLYFVQAALLAIVATDGPEMDITTHSSPGAPRIEPFRTFEDAPGD